MIFLIFLLFNVIWAQETCQSQECQDLAERYLTNMNKSVEPCDNFYQFVCGNYGTNRIVHSRHSTFGDVIGIVDKQLTEIMLNASLENGSYKTTIQAKTFYEACTNLATLERYGTLGLVDHYKIYGNWSLIHEINTYNDTTFEWEVLAGDIMLRAVYPLIKPTAEISADDTDKYILQLGTPELYLGSAANYFEQKPDGTNGSTILEDYRAHMFHVLKEMGVKIDAENVKIIDGIIEFEKSIASMTQLKNKPSNKFGKVMTYAELKKTYSNIKWDKLLQAVTRKARVQMPDSRPINVSNTEYFEKLNSFVKSEPKIKVYHYLMWTFGNFFVRYLHPKYQGNRAILTLRTRSIDITKIPRERACMEQVRKYFAIPLAAEFIRQKLSDKDVEMVEKLSQNLKNVMQTELEEATWMDETTRTAALKKLKQMSIRLDYIDFMQNETIVVEPYVICLSSGHWLSAASKMRQILVGQQLSKLDQKADIDWEFRMLTINAGHRTDRNKMFVAPGILQFPMVLNDAPTFVNYGAFGVTIGHEITHGYDTRGSYFDEAGQHRNWWDPATRQKFNEKAKCFINRNSKELAQSTGKYYDGPNTLGESIADSGGLRIAYQAYKTEMSKKNDSRRLPDFEQYSSDQMFFISYANSFCDVISPLAMKSLLTEPYLYGASRVNLAVRDYGKFSEVFGCSPESPMNKKEEEERCRLW